MKKISVVPILLLMVIACNNNEQKEKEAKEIAAGKDGITITLPSAKDSNVIIINDEGKDSVVNIKQKEPFTEGVLTTTITFPGNPMNDEFKKSNGDFDMEKMVGMIMKTMSDTSKKGDDKAENIKRMMNMMSMAVLPIRSKLYYSKDKILYKGESMTYRYQNLYETAGKTGKFIMISKKNDDNVALLYNAGTQNQLSNRQQIDTRSYSVEKSDEERMIGGYKCRKVTYTHRADSKQQAAGEGMLPETIVAWYTTEIPALLNMDQAFRMDVEGAVLRSEITMNKLSGLRMVYQVTAIQPGKLSAADFNTVKVTEEIDMEKDGKKAAGAMMRIVMGGSMFGMN
jgi:GLPGLI family protein